MFHPSENTKQIMKNTIKRINACLKEERYDLAEQHTELLFRQLMQINDADALKESVKSKI